MFFLSRKRVVSFGKHVTIPQNVTAKKIAANLSKNQDDADSDVLRFSWFLTWKYLKNPRSFAYQLHNESIEKGTNEEWFLHASHLHPLEATWHNVWLGNTGIKSDFSQPGSCLSISLYIFVVLIRRRRRQYYRKMNEAKRSNRLKKHISSYISTCIYRNGRTGVLSVIFPLFRTLAISWYADRLRTLLTETHLKFFLSYSLPLRPLSLPLASASRSFSPVHILDTWVVRRNSHFIQPVTDFFLLIERRNESWPRCCCCRHHHYCCCCMSLLPLLCSLQLQCPAIASACPYRNWCYCFYSIKLALIIFSSASYAPFANVFVRSFFRFDRLYQQWLPGFCWRSSGFFSFMCICLRVCLCVCILSITTE